METMCVVHVCCVCVSPPTAAPHPRQRRGEEGVITEGGEAMIINQAGRRGEAVLFEHVPSC